LRWWAIGSAAIVLFLLPRLSEYLVYVLGYSILAVVFALVVSVGATDKPWPIAQWRLTKLLALTSYSIYLTHANVIQTVLRLHLPTFATLGLMILASVTVGYAFHRAVEKPAITLRDRFIPRRQSAASEIEERSDDGMPSRDIDPVAALS
jgi:peptidoglycan/LPS O-acetylase OafA/YrhL